jgi:uncharacterized C2H2 Zn-finger protein
MTPYQEEKGKMTDTEKMGKTTKETECDVCGQKFDTKEQCETHYDKSHGGRKSKTSEEDMKMKGSKKEMEQSSASKDMSKKKS